MLHVLKLLPLNERDDTLSVVDLGPVTRKFIALKREGLVHFLLKQIGDLGPWHVRDSPVSLALRPEFS